MNWNTIVEPQTETVSQLATTLDVPTVVAKLLAQRGIINFDTAKAFFRPDLGQLHDPFLMLGMTAAVDRILQAIANDEKIMVYGDYDVDGTTAVALLSTYLRTLHPLVDTYIPDRYVEGYGLSEIGINYAHEQDYSLLITLDCGIKAVERVEQANDLGIDCIICDHHLPGEIVPPALAILDPKQAECSYPYKELCGCGVGFKLIQALAQKQNQAAENIWPFLDLVATAIAADIVPLTGENRILAYHGMLQLNRAPRPGLAALLAQSKRKPSEFSDLVFVVAPRINAAGRMAHGGKAVSLLCAQDVTTAQAMAREIESLNGERRSTDERITQEALEQINQLNTPYSTVVIQENWHKGVVGIVASRLIEHHYRPTVVLAASEGKYVGSVRSVKGFNVYEALAACESHLIQFGGHKYAAGLTMDPKSLPAFREAFDQAVQERITVEQRQPSQTYDLEVSLTALTPKLERILVQMAPFGPQNMRPVFRTIGLTDAGGSRAVGNDQKHLKLAVTDGKGTVFSGIGFGMAKHLPKIKAGNSFELLYTLEQNEFNGVKRLQLKVKDLRLTE
ncbi:MAG: single-stranded-DNA-specific exonuclease RecJ [Flavobacteriaceae bacterium]